MSWQQQILRVNLSTGDCKIEPLNMEWAEDYLGQRGLGSKYLLEEMEPDRSFLCVLLALVWSQTKHLRNFFWTSMISSAYSSRRRKCTFSRRNRASSAV